MFCRPGGSLRGYHGAAVDAMRTKSRSPRASDRRGSLRHPVTITAAVAALAVLAAFNVAAFMAGRETPWLLGAVILTDMLLIGVAIFIAAREILVAQHRTETSQAHLDS